MKEKLEKMNKESVRKHHREVSKKRHITRFIGILFIAIFIIIVAIYTSKERNSNSITEKKEISTNNTIKEEYKKIVNYIKNDAEETYALSDINHDGIKELIIITGTGEADKTVYLYTFADGKAVFCGSTWSTHSTYYEEENKNYLIRLTYIQGGETLSYLSLDNDKLKEEVVYKKDVSNDKQFEMSEKQRAINFCNINDFSLIEKMS